jgi:hypothetical protein
MASRAAAVRAPSAGAFAICVEPRLSSARSTGFRERTCCERCGVSRERRGRRRRAGAPSRSSAPTKSTASPRRTARRSSRLSKRVRASRRSAPWRSPWRHDPDDGRAADRAAHRQAVGRGDHPGRQRDPGRGPRRIPPPTRFPALDRRSRSFSAVPGGTRPCRSAISENIACIRLSSSVEKSFGSKAGAAGPRLPWGRSRSAEPGTVQHGDQAYRPDPLILRGLGEINELAHHLRRSFARELPALVIEPRLPIRVSALPSLKSERLSSSRELRPRPHT